MRDFTEQELIEIRDKAKKAATIACNEYFKNVYGGYDRYPCGFAWVEFPDIKFSTKQGKLFKKVFDMTTDRRYVWNPGGYTGQGMDAKYAGVVRYAEVLAEFGIRASRIQRMD